MSNVNAWKRLRFKTGSRRCALELFIREELPETRSVVRGIIAEKRTIDLRVSRASFQLTGKTEDTEPAIA